MICHQSSPRPCCSRKRFAATPDGNTVDVTPSSVPMWAMTRRSMAARPSGPGPFLGTRTFPSHRRTDGLSALREPCQATRNVPPAAPDLSSIWFLQLSTHSEMRARTHPHIRIQGRTPTTMSPVVLITGASGLLDQALTQQLESDYALIGLDVADHSRGGAGGQTSSRGGLSRPRDQDGELGSGSLPPVRPRAQRNHKTRKSAILPGSSSVERGQAAGGQRGAGLRAEAVPRV